MHPPQHEQLGEAGRRRVPLLDDGEAGRRRLPLLEDDEGRHEDRTGGFSWLTALGFGFLTFNSGMAIYRSDRDLGSIAFVAGSYVDLVLLFVCLRLFERTPRDLPRRRWLKACVWALTTLLTVMFLYRVAAMMPPAMAVIVCAMAATGVVAGYCAFFRPSPRQGEPVVNQGRRMVEEP